MVAHLFSRLGMPKQVDDYFKQVKQDNPTYSDEQAWATAWSIYCKHKNPGSEHCHKPTEEYLKGKNASNQEEVLVSRLMARYAARKKAPQPVPVREAPSLSKIVQSAVESAVSRAIDKVELPLPTSLKVSGRSSFSDGVHPEGRHGSLGYSFTVRYPSEAVAIGAIEVTINEAAIVADAVDELSYHDLEAQKDDVAPEVRKVDFEKHIKEMLKFVEFPDSHHDLSNDYLEKIEEAADEQVETTIEAYSEDDPEVSLPEYPDVYLRWRARRTKVEFGDIQRSGATFKVPVKVVWAIKPDKWAFDEGVRSNHWYRISSKASPKAVARRFLASDNKAKLQMGANHPLNGQEVEIVREDPFQRFVVVRILKKVGDYKKGDQLNVKPSQVER